MKIKVILLFFCAVNILFSNSSGDFNILGQAIRLPGEKVHQDFCQKDGSLPIKLILSTDLICDFEFKSDDNIISYNNPVLGRWDIYIKDKTRSVTIFASGFRTKEILLNDIGIINFQQGDAFVFSIGGEPDPELIYCRISTDPSDADIYLDDIQTGKTENGSLGFIAIKGKHLLRIEGIGYRPMEKEIIIDETTRQFSYILSSVNEETPPLIPKPVQNSSSIVTQIHDSDIHINLIYVEGGSFTMGKLKSHDPFLLAHEVEVDDFYISEFEITQKIYRLVMNDNPSYFLSNGQENPVETVSWFNAIEFCNRFSEIDGLELCYEIIGKEVICDFNANGYRLPTEAEWEYASRGGKNSKNTKYPGFDKADACSWHAGNTFSETIQVGMKKANELGLYDMGGNVWEWCWDWYQTYPSDKQKNPKGPEIGKWRVSRGGSWYSSPWNCSCSNRDCDLPDKKASNLGFRVAKSRI